MTLSSLVVSRDWQEVSVLECILADLHMDVTVESDPQVALTRLIRSKIDALIVDRDLEGVSDFLNELPRRERRAPAVPLVVMGTPNCAGHIESSGALFSFEKPVSVENAVRTLSAARNQIFQGRLRYHRAGVDVPVSLNRKNQKLADAHLVNLSQGGLRVHTDDPIRTQEDSFQVSFALPGARSLLKAHAEIAWRDQSGNIGMRFVKIPPRQQRTLQLWLARQYFDS